MKISILGPMTLFLLELLLNVQVSYEILFLFNVNIKFYLLFNQLRPFFYLIWHFFCGPQLMTNFIMIPKDLTGRIRVNYICNHICFSFIIFQSLFVLLIQSKP